MSLLSDLQTIAESCGVSVETGVFSGKAPDTYLVITPLSVLLVPLVLLLAQPASITPAIVIEAIAVMIFLYFIINSS